ncbi:hypothetical protein [Geotoga petraea]|jgi:hypothetical protein|uniref:Uncharacterized protein n=1 Tax=Geotoga petraea TaxID=28234 RepID=A0A1G6PAP1_9BACT|nr:hypothetical protein [Geotoga petraea]MDK2946491.1 hypothetical protein [Geotoga sp.]TGG87941.1 hypothetical protein E4650_06260 [Geotoga petraea]SDC76487.1 hypothetical protein SAMN04488588_1759 [Geotoga petraea]
MKLENIINDYDNLDSGVYDFIVEEDLKEITFPSIILLKGESKEFGKGEVVLADYDRALEIWASEVMEKDITLEFEDNKLSYNIEKLDLPTNWEDFMDYAHFFMESGELDILSYNFENRKEVHSINIQKYEEAIKNMSLIKSEIPDLLTSKENIFTVSVLNSGKMLIFGIDTNEYVKMANKLNNSYEKKYLWLILKIILKEKLLNHFKTYNPALVSQGLMGVFIESLGESDFKRLLKTIKLKLYIKEEQVWELYEKNRFLIKYITGLKETGKKINADGEEKNLWNALEDILLDIIVNGDNQIEELKKVARNLHVL